MERSVEDLRSAVARFRRALAEGYAASLVGDTAADPRRAADKVAPCTAERSAAYVELASSLPAEEHAALGAHMLRAHAERAYASTRAAVVAVAGTSVRVANDTRTLTRWLGDASLLAQPKGRELARRALDDACALPAERVRRGHGEVAGAVGRALSALAPGRHPDAGPEGDPAERAAAFLASTAELHGAALEQLSRISGIELRHALDLWAALRADAFAGFVRSEGRPQRAGEAWVAWGVRDVLSSRARMAPAHKVLSPAAHLLVWPGGQVLRIAPASLEGGLISELALLEATGRALAHALVSRVLPFELRHTSVGTVARAFGGLAVLTLTRADSWRRRYGASRREAEQLARLTTAWWSCHSRLAAAAQCARGRRPEELSELARTALGVEVDPALATMLLTRLSPGGAARAACGCADLAAALREQFDEDWYRNPRAMEPLRGAASRGGLVSIEELSSELGAKTGVGLSLLAELF